MTRLVARSGIAMLALGWACAGRPAADIGPPHLAVAPSAGPSITTEWQHTEYTVPCGCASCPIYAFDVRLTAEPAPASSRHDHELVVTVSNTGRRRLRLGNLPLVDTNTKQDRFHDGSGVSKVHSGGQWLAFRPFTYGGILPAVHVRPEIVVVEPGDSKIFRLTLTYDDEQQLLLVGRLHGIAAGELYGWPVIPGETITLGYELRQSFAHLAVHDEAYNGHFPLSLDDWLGAVRTETIDFVVPPLPEPATTP